MRKSEGVIYGRSGTLSQVRDDISAVTELAGHGDIRTTMRYTHLRTQHLRDIVNRRGKLHQVWKAENE
jgi:site-specific recombinase XerC